MKQLHSPARVTVTADGSRAECTCSWKSSTHATALDALLDMERTHPLSPAVCALCERAHGAGPGRAHHGLRVLTDESTHEQFLVCEEDEERCRTISRGMLRLVHATARTVLPRTPGRRGHLTLVR